MGKLLIVEDHPMTAMITEEIFSSFVDHQDVCHAENMSDLQQLDLSEIEIVLSDLRIPGAAPEQVIDWIGRKLPNAKRFFFTSLEDEHLIEQIKSSGAVYLSKSTKFKEIVEQIQKSLNKEFVKTDAMECRGIYQSLIQVPGAGKPLTIKQARIIEKMSEGLSVKEIAKESDISPDTVKAHLRDAFSRLQVSNGKEAVTRFLEAKRMAERLYGKEAVQKSMCE